MPSTPLHERSAAAPTRVIVVDDTPDMRLLIRVLLNRYADLRIVGEGENGVEAIELAQVHQPDVVLLDLAMPGMDGLEALPHIKRVAPAAEVIVLSAFGADRMASAAVAAGAATYVQKGAAPQEIVSVIAATVGRPVPGLKAPTAGNGSGTLRPGSTGLLPPSALPSAVETRPVTPADSARESATRIIARTAHELRNPVITVGMIADQLLAARASLSEHMVDELLQALVRQIAVLDRLTDDLLTSNQARRGALVVHPVPLGLREALQEVVAAHEGLEIRLDVADDLSVEADPLRLQQMIGNLVSNAVKYGAPPVDITARTVGDGVEIRVADNGPGVPEEFRDRLFEEYTRAEPDTGAGTGLGLFIVASLARAHGGSVRLDPHSPGGTFVLVVPRAGGH